jgi:hypothetical protein
MDRGGVSGWDSEMLVTKYDHKLFPIGEFVFDNFNCNNFICRHL